MRLLSAGLIYVAVSTVAALLLGENAGGLNWSISLCWLFYFDGENIDIQSPFNLGDLGLHLTYIKTFANGMSLWPDSPIYVYSKLRYPAGIDLFDGILTNLGFDLRPQLVATGLLASL